MSKSFYCFLFLVAIVLSSCKQKDVMIPSYLHLNASQLDTKTDKSQGYPSAKIDDYYVFSNGETRGVLAVNSTMPLQNIGKTRIIISPGIKYNGMTEQRAIYPMFNFYQKEIDLAAERVDTVKPVFTYVENTIFPIIEDYDKNGLEFEYNPQFKQIGDTIVKDNSSGAWLPGNYSGRIELKSAVTGSFLEIYSKVFSDWPVFTPFFLELDYKGNIPIVIGLYATNKNLETTRVRMFIANPKTNWNKLYLDLQSEISSRGANMQYRLFFTFSPEGVVNPEAWIDNVKVVYLD